MTAVRVAECHCRQLRVETTGDPFAVSICHCLECQRRTGSAFGAQAGFKAEQVRVTGRYGDFLRVSDEADRKEHVFHFCPECGSQVFYTEPSEPDLVVVSVGSFADPSFPPPTESGYDSRRHAWVQVADSIRADGAFPERLWAMADLFTPMALRVAATLRLADHVAGNAGAPPALAERTGADADALGRLVNHLITAGVLERSSADAVSLTELGEELRGAQPWLDIDGAVGRADLSVLGLLHTVRTGRPAYPLIHGRGFWEDLAAKPALAESFDALMGSRLRQEAPEVVAAYDWGALSHVVDVGGGDGTLLAAILSTHPGVRGTLVELAGPAGAADRVLAAAGVRDRCAVVARSFFEPLPEGADAYVLSGVLHSWDDERALAILRRCVDAAGPAARVLVIEEGLSEAGLRTEMDLRMLVYTGGRERTLDDFERLAAAAGLRVGAVCPATRYRSVIELLT